MPDASANPYRYSDDLADEKPILVNFGCGSTAHPEWVNFDIEPRDPAIRPADFRRPLPLADESADAVYHSHLLEHLDRDDARGFLAENARVLKPGGILRVVVPDLQELCNQYLASLAATERGEPGAAELYEWSRLDLMDQMVRRRNGGKMLDFLESIDLDDHPQVTARMTLELEAYLRDRKAGTVAKRRAAFGRHELVWRGRHILKRLREIAARAAVRVIAGRDAAAAFSEGLFRTGGEVHQWMYDPHSLRRMLTDAGLVEVTLKGPAESGIPGFADYQLDTLDGQVRRPGSLFAEGRKPE